MGTDSIKKTFVDIYDNIKTGIRKTSRFFSPKPPIFVYMNQKSLFEGDFQSPYNLLPKDGVIHYFESFLDHRDSQAFHNKLLHNIDWRHDVLFMFGKKITTKRKVAWYGDKDISYTYSKVTKLSTPWTEELLHLKKLVEEKTETNFNSCLLNLYHDGSEGMGWHSDNEKELKKNGTIASLSLGAERRFYFKHTNTNDRVSINLGNGSLLIMKGETQAYWKHQLPPIKKILSSRINLTFRTIA